MARKKNTVWINENGNGNGNKIAALSVQDEKVRKTEKEKDTFRMNLEKRTSFASQMEEASESLRYRESEELKSEDRATPEAVQSGCCPETVNVVMNEHVTDGNLELGLNQLEVPEADNLLEIVGEIDGRPAKILLNTGCSTYELSPDLLNSMRSGE